MNYFLSVFPDTETNLRGLVRLGTTIFERKKIEKWEKKSKHLTNNNDPKIPGVTAYFLTHHSGNRFIGRRE